MSPLLGPPPFRWRVPVCDPSGVAGVPGKKFVSPERDIAWRDYTYQAATLGSSLGFRCPRPRVYLDSPAPLIVSRPQDA